MREQVIRCLARFLRCCDCQMNAACILAEIEVQEGAARLFLANHFIHA